MQGGYYQPTAMPGMTPGMVGSMGMQGMQPGMMGQGMMQPGMMGQGHMGQGMMGGGMGGVGGMGMGGSPMYGQAWRQLGYNYQPPALEYTPDSTWDAWGLAQARYNGSRLERGFFDNLLNGLTNFFSNRHLSEDAARSAHRRVYYAGEGQDAGNKTLGGSAAYQAYLFWDRDHHSAYHQYPSEENRQRLVGLAVAELFALWDRVQPRSSRAEVNEAAEYAAATAKYLFDRHYDLSHSHQHHDHHHSHSRRSGHGADDDSDSASESRYRRQRPSMFGGGSGYGMQGQMPMPMPAAGMGMTQPGMGAMGMPGAMGPMQMGGAMGMGGQGMGIGMQPGMGMMPQQQMGMMPMQGGMMPPQFMGQGGGMGMMPGQAGFVNPMGEAQSMPGMHPWHYGTQSGVAYGNQPIDGMGHPPMLPGQGRSWYGYGQPRYY